MRPLIWKCAYKEVTAASQQITPSPAHMTTSQRTHPQDMSDMPIGRNIQCISKTTLRLKGYMDSL